MRLSWRPALAQKTEMRLWFVLPATCRHGVLHCTVHRHATETCERSVTTPNASLATEALASSLQVCSSSSGSESDPITYSVNMQYFHCVVCNTFFKLIGSDPRMIMKRRASTPIIDGGRMFCAPRDCKNHSSVVSRPNVS